jgi:hypothetical protein
VSACEVHDRDRPADDEDRRNLLEGLRAGGRAAAGEKDAKRILVSLTAWFRGLDRAMSFRAKADAPRL